MLTNLLGIKEQQPKQTKEPSKTTLSADEQALISTLASFQDSKHRFYYQILAEILVGKIDINELIVFASYILVTRFEQQKDANEVYRNGHFFANRLVQAIFDKIGFPFPPEALNEYNQLLKSLTEVDDLSSQASMDDVVSSASSTSARTLASASSSSSARVVNTPGDLIRRILDKVPDKTKQQVVDLLLAFFVKITEGLQRGTNGYTKKTETFAEQFFFPFFRSNLTKTTTQESPRQEMGTRPRSDSRTTGLRINALEKGHIYLAFLLKKLEIAKLTYQPCLPKQSTVDTIKATFDEMQKQLSEKIQPFLNEADNDIALLKQVAELYERNTPQRNRLTTLTGEIEQCKTNFIDHLLRDFNPIAALLTGAQTLDNIRRKISAYDKDLFNRYEADIASFRKQINDLQMGFRFYTDCLKPESEAKKQFQNIEKEIQQCFEGFKQKLKAQKPLSDALTESKTAFNALINGRDPSLLHLVALQKPESEEALTKLKTVIQYLINAGADKAKKTTQYKKTFSLLRGKPALSAEELARHSGNPTIADAIHQCLSPLEAKLLDDAARVAAAVSSSSNEALAAMQQVSSSSATSSSSSSISSANGSKILRKQSSGSHSGRSRSGSLSNSAKRAVAAASASNSASHRVKSGQG